MFYWVLKTVVLGPILKLLFRPWVEGEENIPDEGAAIIGDVDADPVCVAQGMKLDRVTIGKFAERNHRELDGREAIALAITMSRCS